MKKVTGFILILAVLILGGYYGMGVLTENTLKKDIVVIDQTNGLFAQIEEYNRSWFSSNARIKWRLHIPERIIAGDKGESKTIPAQDFQMDMPVKIYHGPIIFAHNKVRFGMGYAETVLDLPPEYIQQFNELFTADSTKPNLHLNIFVNYLNASVLELSLPPFKLVSKDNQGQFDWMGMNSNTKLSSNLNTIVGDIVLDGMQISKDELKVALAKVTSTFDLHQTPTGLYLGNGNFVLPSFDITIKDAKIFDINNFTVKSESDIRDNLFSTHLSASLTSLTVQGKHYGPGDLDITLRNLDAEVLADFNRQANATQNGTEAQRQQAMMAMIPQLPKLFSKGAEFEISKLTMKLPEGILESHLLVAIPAGDSSNPFELLQKIHGNAKIKMPKAVVKQLALQSVSQQSTRQAELQQAIVQQMQNSQTPNQNQPTVQPQSQPNPAELADKQVAEMEQNGVLIPQGEDYVIEFGLEQGKFTVNGKPFDSSMFK